MKKQILLYALTITFFILLIRFCYLIIVYTNYDEYMKIICDKDPNILKVEYRFICNASKASFKVEFFLELFILTFFPFILLLLKPRITIADVRASIQANEIEKLSRSR